MDHIEPLETALSEPRTAVRVIEPGVEAFTTLPRIRVLHIVADLRTGGAEIMLARLINNSDSRIFEHHILSMRSAGDFRQMAQNKQVSICVLGINGWLSGVFHIFSLRRAIRKFRPHVIHTWLYHANVVGGVSGRLWSNAKIVWGLHSGWLSHNHTKRLTLLMRRVGGWLSGWVPDSIICCAHSVKEVHAGLGYTPDKLAIVSNGVELDRFYPDNLARQILRSEWRIAPDQLTIGMIARFDPQKDVCTFLEAASIVRRYYPNVRFILCGPGFDPNNQEVIEQLKRRHLLQHVTLLGFRSDIPRVMAALDTLVLSSRYGEALPLVVMEAMACGLPVVASDIGDIQRITGRWGTTVTPGSAGEFAEAILAYARLTEDKRRELSLNARQRVAEMFPLAKAIDQHEALYRHLLEVTTTSTKSTVGWLVGDIRQNTVN